MYLSHHWSQDVAQYFYLKQSSAADGIIVALSLSINIYIYILIYGINSISQINSYFTW